MRFQSFFVLASIFSASATISEDELNKIERRLSHLQAILRHQELNEHSGRYLQVPTPKFQCLLLTSTMLDASSPGGIQAPLEFGDFQSICTSDFSLCDFSGSTYQGDAEINCENVGGRMRYDSFTICDEDGTGFSSVSGDLNFVSIPVCLNRGCEPDIEYFDLIRGLYQLLNGGDDTLTNTFEKKCEPVRIDWVIPSSPYSDRMVAVGDVVIFNYEPFHNVYIHPDGDCTSDGAVLVGSQNDSPTVYTFQDSDGGNTVTFACDVGSHCEDGQIITFDVSMQAQTPPPTESPRIVPTVSSSPTKVPTKVPTHAPSRQTKNPTEIPTIPPSNSPSHAPSSAPTLLSAQEFKEGIDSGKFDVILDVRSQNEWLSGHIAGATFADSLASFGSNGHNGATPSDLAGCERCTIAVYCRSGARAAAAVQVLLANGFQGMLYNGQGTNQWIAAGYGLVSSGSLLPTCTTTQDQCANSQVTLLPTPSPSLSPANNDAPDLPKRKQPKSTTKDQFKLRRGIAFNPNIRGGYRYLRESALPETEDQFL